MPTPEMKAVARTPPSQIECLPPRSGQFRAPTPSPVVVGPPLQTRTISKEQHEGKRRSKSTCKETYLSAVNTHSVLAVCCLAASALLTLVMPSSTADSMPAKVRRLGSAMLVLYASV